MKNPLEAISGKRTYIVAIALIIYAVAGWIAGKIDPNSAFENIMIALGLMGLRAGVTNSVAPGGKK